MIPRLRQRWQLQNAFGALYAFTIEAFVEEAGRKIALGTTDGGRPARVAVSALETGRRGARCLSHPEPPEFRREYAAKLLAETVEERRKASECVKPRAPRGLTHASDRDREVLRLRDVEGLSTRALVDRLGMTRGQVDGALKRAREAAEEERNARATRRTA